MSESDVDLIRSLLPPPEVDVAALLRTDERWQELVDGLEPLVDPEVESIAVWQGRRAHLGLEGFRRMWLDWLEPWAVYHSQLDELIDAGDCVVAVTHDRGERPDVDGEVDILAGSTWKVREGKVVEVVFYGNREDALAAAEIER